MHLVITAAKAGGKVDLLGRGNGPPDVRKLRGW